MAQRPDVFRPTPRDGRTPVWHDQAIDEPGGAFLMRGLETIRAESSLTALVYNLRRVLNILRLPKPIDLGVAKADSRAPL
jgi:hypothetical protein